MQKISCSKETYKVSIIEIQLVVKSCYSYLCKKGLSNKFPTIEQVIKNESFFVTCICVFLIATHEYQLFSVDEGPMPQSRIPHAPDRCPLGKT